MDGTARYIEQGKSLLVSNASKIRRVQTKIDSYNSYSGLDGPTNELYENVVESFTGMSAQKSEQKSAEQRNMVDTLSAKFKKTLSEYATAEKSLSDIASSYVNMQESSKTLKGRFIKGSGPEVGYITEQNEFLPVPSSSVLDSMKGKLGCPSNVDTVDGKLTGTNPNMLISKPLATAQSCAPTGVILQAIGATNPNTNIASWHSCTKPNDSWRQDSLSTTSRDEALLQCHLNAADQGFPAFGITLNTDNTYKCSLAPQGTNMENITTNAFSIKTQTTLANINSATTNTIFTLLYNGQMATGELAVGNNDIAKMSSYTALGYTGSAIAGCEPLNKPSVKVTSASYGVNCNGQQIPEYAQIGSTNNVYNVKVGNWTDITNKQVEGQEVGTYVIGSDNILDPAIGCGKAYSASYTCTGRDQKSVSIVPEASGQPAVFNCSDANAKCASPVLTLTDDGNLTLTNGSGSVIWQTGAKSVPTIAYPSRVASNGKYKRNYLRAGEFLRNEEFIGSPSGTFWIIPILNSSNQLNIGVMYAVISCIGVTNVSQKPSITGTYGDVGSDNSSMGVYKMSSGSVSNVARQLTYVDNMMQSRAIQSSALGSIYTKFSEYDAPNSTLSNGTLTGLTSEQCQAKCTERTDCYGVVFSKNSDKCLLKGSGMFPNGTRTPNSASDIYVRMFNSGLDSSCSSDVKASYNDIMNGLPIGEPMKSSTQCGLSQALAQQQALVKTKASQLNNVAQEVSTALTAITAEGQNIDERLLKEMRKLQMDTAVYEKTLKKSTDVDATISTTNAMESTSRLEMSSDSVKYMVWASIAGLGVLAALKAAH